MTGLVARPWSTRRRGISPSFSFSISTSNYYLCNQLHNQGNSLMKKRTLSLFIDESGDFGAYEPHSPYYIIAIVLHNQSINIQEDIRCLESHISNSGYPPHAIHTGPLIRRESIYSNDLLDSRKRLFNALFHFARKVNYNYFLISIKKSECSDIISMTSKLSKAIVNQLSPHLEYWNSFEEIIIYYDNGQVDLTKILTSVSTLLFSSVQFRKVKPVDYKLFQVADLICTIELLSKKADSNSFTKSELLFFQSIRQFKKNYLKPIRKNLFNIRPFNSFPYHHPQP